MGEPLLNFPSKIMQFNINNPNSNPASPTAESRSDLEFQCRTLVPGSAVFKVCRISQPWFSRCFNDGSEYAEILGTFLLIRKHPEIICRTFVILSSRSASLFVNGTVRSFGKSKTAAFRALNRKARLCSMRRSLRPRFFRFDGGVRGGWLSWNVIACSQQASNRRSISLIASGSTASRP